MGVRWAQSAATTFAELIGDSESIRDVRRLIDQVAESNSTVLVTGPSGSGKFESAFLSSSMCSACRPTMRSS